MIDKVKQIIDFVREMYLKSHNYKISIEKMYNNIKKIYSMQNIYIQEENDFIFKTNLWSMRLEHKDFTVISVPLFNEFIVFKKTGYFYQGYYKINLPNFVNQKTATDINYFFKQKDFIYCSTDMCIFTFINNRVKNIVLDFKNVDYIYNLLSKYNDIKITIKNNLIFISKIF